VTLLGDEERLLVGAPDGYEDEILIHKDKNSNTAGVKELAPTRKPFERAPHDVAAGASRTSSRSAARRRW
jgi:hypothetical protein